MNFLETIQKRRSFRTFDFKISDSGIETTDKIRYIASIRYEKQTVAAVCYRICQSIGLYPFDMRKSLVLENGLEPKKPL